MMKGWNFEMEDEHEPGPYDSDHPLQHPMHTRSAQFRNAAHKLMIYLPDMARVLFWFAALYEADAADGVEDKWKTRFWISAVDLAGLAGLPRYAAMLARAYLTHTQLPANSQRMWLDEVMSRENQLPNHLELRTFAEIKQDLSSRRFWLDETPTPAT